MLHQYLLLSTDVRSLNNLFYVKVKETLYSEPWSAVLSRDLGSSTHDSAISCEHYYSYLNRQHPFYDWAFASGLDLENKPFDRLILFVLLGSPKLSEFDDAIAALIRLVGKKYEPYPQQLRIEAEQDMTENTDVCVSKDETYSWFVEYNGRKYPIKMGGLPKRESVYSEPFYNFVNGSSKVGICVRNSNYTVEVGANYEILSISGGDFSDIKAMMIPHNHPFFDLVKTEVDVKSLFNG